MFKSGDKGGHNYFPTLVLGNLFERTLILNVTFNLFRTPHYYVQSVIAIKPKAESRWHIASMRMLFIFKSVISPKFHTFVLEMCYYTKI
jgi:hypothetical protein